MGGSWRGEAGEWLDLDFVLFHPSLKTRPVARMLGLARQLPPCCVGSGDGSASAVSEGRVLLDIQVTGGLVGSKSELVNSQLLLGKANHYRK